MALLIIKFDNESGKLVKTEVFGSVNDKLEQALVKQYKTMTAYQYIVVNLDNYNTYVYNEDTYKRASEHLALCNIIKCF